MTDQHKHLPGTHLKAEKMPGHWLLAQMGKRVLRPGGLELTEKLLAALAIQTTDHVVEFAPGLGLTAQLALAKSPASYTGIEADDAAAAQVQTYLKGDKQTCIVGKAEQTSLPDTAATVVYGEAMLTMQTPSVKQKIVAEAKRLLVPGGRYGIHELCLVPDDLDDEIKLTIQQALSKSIHVGARPLTVLEWKTLLESQGFIVRAQATAPMHLLKLSRMIQDEGIGGTLRIMRNVAGNPAARERILAMRKVFKQYEHHLAAVMLVAEVPPIQ